MLYTIENERVQVTVNSLGAELWSIKTKADNCEYIWQGDERYWMGRAYNLFPICGRLFEGKYTYQGETYEMKLHGFLRNAETRLVEQSETSLAFELTETAETLAQYPFRFRIVIGYELEAQTVHHTFTVENTDTKDLIFAVGGHPGFNVPLTDGETFEDYFVEFDSDKQPQLVVMSDTCFDTGYRRPFPLEDSCRLPLRHDLFNVDAIFLTYMSDGITLRSKKSDKFVHLYYPDMNALGLWHKPRTDAPYICIEPWYSVPSYDGEVDDLEQKQLMVHLAPDCVYENTYNITVG
ncbi:MAG: aldose 1-epimerase family protein [Ruminococcaceae bacterium]|nr:aldose 1-epimerase family protein [Oscillospiraceae bacterium]